MRSCIYCGKELEKGEICGCPQSAARRAKNQSGAAETAKTKKNTKDSRGTTYRTGYTGHQSKFERAKERHRARRADRKNAGSRGYFKNFFGFVKMFIKSPVDKVINPPQIGKASMLLIAAAQGAVAWLGMFFLYTGTSRSVFAMLGKLMGFGGIEGYSSLLRMLLCAVSGAVSGIALFFLYTGVFWLLNRFVFKSTTKYWDFSLRLSLIGIPFTVLGALGVILSVLSLKTLLLLFICGLLSSVVLMYEALRTEWINRSASSVMYAMIGGLFILFTVLLYLIRI